MQLDLLTSLPGDTPASKPASRLPSTATDAAWMARTLASGGSICDLCGPSGPYGSLSKIRQASVNGPIRFRLVWRGLATEYPCLNLRLAIVVRLISEGVCSLLPTVTARDYRSPGRPNHPRLLMSRGHPLPEELGIRVSPEFCEWMLGFPPGWTELPPSEIHAIRESRKRFSGK